MKKAMALTLLVSMLCTSICAIDAHGAEDPCGKGCPLIEKYVLTWGREELDGRVTVGYYYDCGWIAEGYTENVLQVHAIYNYSEDIIKQYIRQSNGSFEYCPVPVPVRHVIVAPKTEN